ncbi:B3 domain-containing protein REM16-like [Amaranthus tricolor]|uniref:B3 domain-containing protein REM16-like n=1 Tax=Amaranthus tricolor TaxID=29722 RepID=UPI00258A93E6|nr:B3 domain-containing protein REM16-like [Amaranthus tricolor]
MHCVGSGTFVIPKKFSENVKEKLQETVTLKSPNGTASWQVKLMARNDALILKDGWREFLNAFSVRKNDILIFKYIGKSCFHIQIFDRHTLCENETSYFIRKCSHSESDKTHQDQDPKFVKQSPDEVMHEYLHDDFESVPPKKHRGDIASTEEKPQFQKQSWTWEPVTLPQDGTTKQKSITKEHRTDIVTYMSKRRPVTEEEKNRAYQMAAKELTEGSFLMIMRPSHVYRKFFLSFPAEWISKYFTSYEKRPVHLRVKDRTWSTRLIFSSKRRGGLSFGWKDFSLDNCLEEFDVCMFKLASLGHEPALLDVSIFRVVPDAVKSIRVSPASSKSSSNRHCKLAQP